VHDYLTLFNSNQAQPTEGHTIQYVNEEKTEQSHQQKDSIKREGLPHYHGKPQTSLQIVQPRRPKSAQELNHIKQHVIDFNPNLTRHTKLRSFSPVLQGNALVKKRI